MVWLPSLRVLEKLPLLPIDPSMLEVQTRLLVKVVSSSSVSLADPAKLIVAPEAGFEPSAGLEMEAVGGSLGRSTEAAPLACTRP